MASTTMPKPQQPPSTRGQPMVFWMSKIELFAAQLMDKDPKAIGIAVAVLVGFLTLLYILYLSRRKIFRRTVVLVGPCFSGKTTLFSKLLSTERVETFTSMKENISENFTVDKKKNRSVKLVDLPGHERLRASNLEKYKSSIKAIIYVIDSSTIQKQIRDTTEYVFNILSDPLIHSNRIPVLFFCNKQDETMAKGAAVIRRELEKEIDLLRETQSKTLKASDDSAIERVFLGKSGKTFSFDDIRNQVEFVEGSATDSKADDGGLDEIKVWLATIV